MEDQITDKEPVPWGAVPPWRVPGAFRLDAEPHRAPLLRGLAGVALAAGGLSVLPLVAALLCGLSIIPPAVGASALVAFALGAGVWMLAQRDLAQMGRGLMDPRGKPLTKEAKKLGQMTVLLAVWCAAAWGLILLVLDR